MTIVAFPLNGPTVTAENARQALSALLGPAPSSSRPLGSVSGVRPGTPSTTVTATATTWTVKPHSGVLDLETPVASGPLPYAVVANATGSMTAANGSNDRIDLLTVKSNEPEESDGSVTPGVTLQYYAGTAASSPTPPATPSGEMALAQIRVPALGTGSPVVTFVAPPLPGMLTAYSSSSARPNNPVAPFFGYNYNTDAFEVWDGTQWTTYTGTESTKIVRTTNITVPDSTVVVPTSGWNFTGGWNIPSVGGVTYNAGTLVAGHSGLHRIDWDFRWGTVPTSTTAWLRQVSWQINGTGVNTARLVQMNPANLGSSLTYMSSSGMCYLNAGDAVGPAFYQSGSSGAQSAQVTEGTFALTYVGTTP